MLPPPRMADKKNRNWQAIAVFLALMGVMTGCKPAGPRALLNGKRFIEEGRYEEAVESLNTATSILKTNAQAWNYLGLAYQYAGKPSNAVPAYEQALRIDHDLTEAHFNLGCLWLDENKLDAAKVEFSAVTLRRATSVDGWLKLGQTKLRMRDIAGAEGSFNEVLKLSPQNPEALNGLGMAALQRNRPRDAAQFFNNALKAKPDYAPAVLNLAVVDQAYLNDRPGAIQRYHEYLALNPPRQNADAVNAALRGLELPASATNRPVTNVVAQPRMETPKPTNVVAVAASPSKPEPAKPIVESHPAPAPPVERPMTNPPPVTRVTMTPTTATPPMVTNTVPPKRNLFERINPLNVFRAREERGTTVTPLPPEKNMGTVTPLPPVTNSPTPVVHAATPKPEITSPAAASFARYKYHSLKPKAGNRAAAEQPFANGLQAQNAGQYAEATRDYLQAAQADPTYFGAQYNLGWAAASAGNLGQSLLAYEYCLVLKPDSADARYNFALVLKRSNYAVDAVEELEKIVADNPQDARAHLAAGNLYAEQLHDPVRARAHYSKVLELDPNNSQATAIRFWMYSNPQ